MTFTLVPLFPGIPGGPELLIVLLIVVLLFGANKLPQLARSSGQAMGEFRRGREEIDREIQSMSEGTDSEDAAETNAETDSPDADSESTDAEEETDADRTTTA